MPEVVEKVRSLSTFPLCAAVVCTENWMMMVSFTLRAR